MKKGLSYFLLTMLMLFVGMTANADSYLYEFDSPLNTSDHSFAPPGWGHIVQSAYLDYDSYYVDYTYSSTGGVEGSGCLGIGSQTLWDDYEEESETVYDLLVTPLIKSGSTASIAVKRQQSSGSISFYIVSKDANGQFKRNNIISGISTTGLNSTTYTTVNIPAQSSDYYLGIRGDGVYIDNFMAADADIEQKQALSINSATSQMVDYNANADNKFTVVYNVNVTNSGTMTIDPANMPAGKSATLDLINVNPSNDSTVLASATLPKSLEAGDAENGIALSATVNAADYPDECQYLIRENVSGTIYSAGKFKIIGHTPKFEFTDESVTGSAFPNDTTINFTLFGKNGANATFYVRNSGGSDLNVTGITTTDNVSVDVTTPFTVAAQGSAPVKVSLSGANKGDFTGSLNINSNAGDYKLNITGEVADSTKFFTDFENGIPSGYYNENSAWYTDNNPSEAKVYGSSKGADPGYSEGKKLITPKLQFASGEKLRVDVARTSSYSTATLNVSYSTDRKNWTVLRTLSSDADKDGADWITDVIAAKGSWTNYYAFSTFDIDIPEGEGYIAFDGKNISLDNIYGGQEVAVEHDIMLTSSSIPSSGDVNTRYNAKATFTSLLAAAEPADGYTVKLYFDDEAVASAETKTLHIGNAQEFPISFVPQKAGTFKATIKLEAGDYVVSTDPVDVTIAAETSVQVKEAPEHTDVGSAGTPIYINTNGKNENQGRSYTEIVYTASQIGLPAGTKINKLVYRGYCDVYNGPRSVAVTGFIEETADNKPDNELHDTLTMTKVLDETLSYDRVGDENNHADMLTINFEQPFVYNGGNLRLIFATYATQNMTLSFEYNDNREQARRYYYDYWNDATNEYFRQPSLYIYAESNPRKATGTVTAKATSAPIAGAKVEFENDGVKYTGTTDESGKYDITVYKYDRKYNLAVTAPGYLPDKTDSVSLVDADFQKDFALNAADRLYVEKFAVDTVGSVNKPINASVTYTNYTSEAIAAADYTVQLYAGKEVVAKGKTEDIAVGETKTVNFVYTPHADGTVTHHAELAITDGKTASTDSINTVIATESGTKVVATGEENNNNNTAPLYPYYKYSQSQIIYPADYINLAAGTELRSFSFRGYTEATNEAAVKVWMEETDDVNNEGNFAEGDTTKMTVIYDDTLHVTPAGSGSDYATLFTITLPEGTKYQGKNIRLVFQTYAPSSFRMNFSDDSNQKGTTYYRYTDDYSGEGITALYKTDFREFYGGTPVMFIEASTESEVSGKVTSARTGEAIAGASVLLKSTEGDVEYSATTDADGNYDITVLQIDKKYVVNVSAPRYVTSDKDTVSIGDENVVNVVLKDVPVQITGTLYGLDLNTEAAPLEGTTVAITINSDVLNATTDVEGKFTVEYDGAEGTASVEYSKEAYTTKTSTFEFNYDEPVITLTDTLHTKDLDGIDAIRMNAEGRTNGAVYTIDGKFVGKGIDIKALPRGTYIIDRKKITVK